MLLKQFVPSSVCLECQGCCRFQEPQSPWRPKVGQAETLAGDTDVKGYLTTKPGDGCVYCRHFNPVDNTCGVYTIRPFECQLYPFILSKEDTGIKVYMHLACPHIQQSQGKEDLDQYTDYLKEFLNSVSSKEYLSNNQRLLHDYHIFQDELMFLFQL